MVSDRGGTPWLLREAKWRFGRLRFDVVVGILTPSHAYSNVVARICDAISRHCADFFKRLSCKVVVLSVSSLIEPKSRVYLPKAIQVTQICLWCIDSGCSKHMTENLKFLVNFVWKFLGTVCFGNDHVAAILDLKVAFRRNICFVKNLEGVDLLKENCTTNLYTINLHEMASASLICLIARSTSTKFWLLHQRLSHLNFNTINDLAKNDPVTDLPKFKYHKEHLCPSSKSKDKAPEEIKTVLKKITILLQAPVIIAELINGRKPDISFLHVFGALYYPKNDREDIGKLGAKGDIGFFIGYSATSCAYRAYNRRTKKIMEMMNVTFDELSAMAFEQRISKPGL
ncbi:integrase, catalytic region, zinc finger, CCHC-type containing protein [Tanacetum coccineum]